MSGNTNQNNDEVDLGKLFSLIGNGFNKIGNAINRFLCSLGRVILFVFLFLYKHKIKLFISLILGAGIGWVFDLSKPSTYESVMVVKPNYNSGRQLYKNIAYYNELVAQKKHTLLATTFGITEDEAKLLISFKIRPIENEENMLTSYNSFLETIDSVRAVTFTYDKYIRNFKDFSFNKHEIIVESFSSVIFNRLEKSIIEGIVNNKYFEKLELAENMILIRNEKYLKSSLSKIDTLRKVYQEISLSEAKKKNSNGTNINMSGGFKESKDLNLFAEEIRINEELDHLNRVRAKNTAVLNVISDFQDIGFEMKKMTDKWMFRLGVLFVLLTLLSLIGKENKHRLDSQVQKQ